MYKDTAHEVTSSSQAEKLLRLARSIGEREDVIEALKRKAAQSFFAVLVEAKLQGQDLIHAKSLVPYGYWHDWLKANCPRSARMATNYMRIAQNWRKISEANSLRSAIGLLTQGSEESGAEESRQWPPYMEAIGRVSKVVGFVQAHPIKEWPREGIEKLREQMLPLAEELWPELFDK